MEEQLRAVLARQDALEQRNTALEAELVRVRTESNQQGQAFGTQLAAQLAALPDALARAVQPKQSKHLVDMKGLGRPKDFNNVEAEFVMWARRLQNYIAGVYPFARELLAQAAESDEATGAEHLDTQQSDTTTTEIDELDNQLYTCLLSLTQGESADLVVGAGEGEGFEAWRKLHPRWDPLTISRCRGLLREIISPGRAKL